MFTQTLPLHAAPRPGRDHRRAGAVRTLHLTGESSAWPVARTMRRAARAALSPRGRRGQHDRDLYTAAVVAWALVALALATFAIGIHTRITHEPAVVDREFGVLEPAVKPSTWDQLVLLGWVTGGVLLFMAAVAIVLHHQRRPHIRGADRHPRGRHR